MLEDCKFGDNSDLSEHLNNAVKTLKEKNFTAALKEEDTKF